MEKIIEHFKAIVTNVTNAESEDDFYKRVSNEAANEARKIAIDYAEWRKSASNVGVVRFLTEAEMFDLYLNDKTF